MNRKMIEGLVGELAPIVRAYVEREVEARTAPILARLAAVEARPAFASALKSERGELVIVLSTGALVETGIRDGVSPPAPDIESLRIGLSHELNGLLPQVVEAALAKQKAVKSAVIASSGQLVLTFADGSTKELGQVVGFNGRDGEPGAPGAPGLGFDDLAVEHDGERLLTIRFSRGDQVKEFSATIPAIIDRGVYKPGARYAKGDAVTYAGSLWIAQGDASSRPDEGSGEWRLAVKKGRDGK